MGKTIQQKASDYADRNTPAEPSDMGNMRRQAATMLSGRTAPNYEAGLADYSGRPDDAALLRAKARLGGAQDRSRIVAAGAQGVMAGNDFDMRRQALREMLRRTEFQDELAKKQALQQALVQMGMGVFNAGAGLVGSLAGRMPMPSGGMPPRAGVGGGYGWGEEGY
jgi:hypothetical protein